MYFSPFYKVDDIKAIEIGKPYQTYISLKAPLLCKKVQSHFDYSIKKEQRFGGEEEGKDQFIFNVFNSCLYATLRGLELYCEENKFWDSKVGWKEIYLAELKEDITDELKKDIISTLENVDKVYDGKMQYILNEKFDVVDDISNNADFSSGIEEVFGEFIKKISGNLSKEKANEKKLINYLEGIKNIFKITINLSKKNKHFYDNFTGIDINMIKNNADLKTIFECYKNIENAESFITIKLGGFSSGEEALLNIFSRFSQLGEKGLKDNLIIMMDEPELYFHPEWQRTLIYRLINFFENNEDYKGENIQIILTSNAPYILSDMPKGKITCLYSEKDVEGHYNIIKSKNNFKNKQTFAANIHTLLTNTFFMENTIGEFASEKIRNVVKDLNEKTEVEIINDSGRKEEIENIIKNIGEPIIKRKLEQMYNSLFKKNIDDYKLEIEKLKREKTELEQKYKATGLDNIENIMNLLNTKIKELQEKAGDS